MKLDLRPGRAALVTFVAALLPFLLIALFPRELYLVADGHSYLIFHNFAEFFSVVVSFSIFGVGWYSYDQSGDRHALFLSAVFLAVGLVDFMHALSYVGMPDLFTPNTTDKGAQFWIAARLFAALSFFASGFIRPQTENPLLAKIPLLIFSLGFASAVFIAIIFFPAMVPTAFVEGVGLTPFKKNSEYLIMLLFFFSLLVYRRKAGEAGVAHFQAAFVVCMLSEFAFVFYQSAYDSYNGLGHLYKIAAFYLIYKGVFETSVRRPYERLSEVNEKLRIEIEEHEKTQRQLADYRDHLEELVATRTSALEAANRELESFAYSVSHDLRAPLRAIDGFSRILIEDHGGELTEEGRRIAGVVRDNAQKMGRLIDDILAFSRMGRKEMQAQTIDMEKLAREVYQELREQEGGRKIEFKLEKLPPARGDAALIRQVFVNLLSNALKYSRGKPVAIVEVGAEAAAGENIYSVKDNGVGFDMRYYDKLFGVFQRLHGDQEFEGTGIGLAIVKRIVERHGGRVWGEAEVGAGATFHFSLPKP